MNAKRNAGGSSKTITDLVIELASHDGMERQHARERLVALGKPAVAPLLKVLKDDRETVRWEAAKAFTELHDVAAAPALAVALEDPVADVRWLAAEALVRLGQAGLAPVLVALMRHSDSVELREAAHHVLHNLRAGELAGIVEPVLRTLESYEPELAVPFSAEEALNALRRLGG